VDLIRLDLTGNSKGGLNLLKAENEPFCQLKEDLSISF